MFVHMEVTRELVTIKQRKQDQLRALQSEVDAIDKAIELLEREKQSEASTGTSKEFANTGFADGCRSIVGSEFITPPEVRGRLIRGGFKHESKSKVLGGVYATLKRLAGPNGPLETGTLNGKKAYRVKQNPE